MIRISKLSEEGGHWTDPQARSSLLGQAGTDYYKATVIARAYTRQAPAWPLFFFQLPTMHQALELVTKAISHKGVANFDPLLHRHSILSLMRDNSEEIEIFSTVLQDQGNIELLEGLEKSYIGMRYAECSFSYDGDTWVRYEEIFHMLINDLRERTGLRFPTE